jgi:hypothetical protein
MPAPLSRPVGPAVDWRAEAVAGGLITVFSALLGGALGPIWHAVAPRLNLVAANDGSEAATKLLIGDDLWLGLLGIVAGVGCVFLLVITFPGAARGPGAVIGLAAGGILGSLVAAHVGHQIGHRQMVSALGRTFPDARPGGIKAFLTYYDFRVRAQEVLIGWPVAAVACAGLVSVAGLVRDTGRPAAAL